MPLKSCRAQSCLATAPALPPPATDCQPPACCAPADRHSCPAQQQPVEGHFSLQLELARLRRERDEAAAASSAELRRERAESAALRARLEALQAEHAALREQHAAAALRGERAAAARAAEAEAAAREAERLRAAHAQLAGERRGQALQVEALETKLAVLLDAYKALEAERACLPGPSSTGSSAGACLRTARASAVAVAEGAAPDPPLWLTAAPAECEAAHTPRSHLGLALRCAELQHRLTVAQRQAGAAQAAATAADEQVAGLRLLLASQQAASGGGAGSAGALQLRVEGLAQQLQEARELGLVLRQQLTQASVGPQGGGGAGRGTGGALKQSCVCPVRCPAEEPALRCAHRSATPQKYQELRQAAADRARLQRDLQAMLAARQALASLQASLQGR